MQSHRPAHRPSTFSDITVRGIAVTGFGFSVLRASGNSARGFKLSIDTAQLLPAHTFITVVASGPSGTSEFSRCTRLDDSLFANGFE